MPSDEKLTTAVQCIDDLPMIEDYPTADSRFVFVQEEFALFYTLVKPHSTMNSHVHPKAHQFSFIVQGTGQVEMGDQRLDVKKGMCIRIPAGVYHSWYNPNDQMLDYLEVKIPSRGSPDMIRYCKDIFPNIDDRKLGIGI